MCLLLMIYEINHIFFMCLFLDETEVQRAKNFFFLRLGPPCLRDWMTSTPLPPPTPFSEGLDVPLRACLQAHF